MAGASTRVTPPRRSKTLAARPGRVCARPVSRVRARPLHTLRRGSIADREEDSNAAIGDCGPQLLTAIDGQIDGQRRHNSALFIANIVVRSTHWAETRDGIKQRVLRAVGRERAFEPCLVGDRGRGWIAGCFAVCFEALAVLLAVVTQGGAYLFHRLGGCSGGVRSRSSPCPLVL